MSAVASSGTGVRRGRKAWGRCNKRKQANSPKFSLSPFSSSKVLNSYLCPFPGHLAPISLSSLSAAGSWARKLEKTSFLWIRSFYENVPQRLLLHQGDKDILPGMQRETSCPGSVVEYQNKILTIKTVWMSGEKKMFSTIMS